MTGYKKKPEGKPSGRISRFHFVGCYFARRLQAIPNNPTIPVASAAIADGSGTVGNMQMPNWTWPTVLSV